MKDTAEKIRLTALHLFAQRGYEAVSTADIAGVLGITKGALYRHYPDKQAIFDSIITLMEQRDARQAEAEEVPVQTAEQEPQAYCRTRWEDLLSFSKTMFRYWTEDPVARDFRRMLTLEQYRVPDMARLYRQYIDGGPVDYLADIFSAWGWEAPREKAMWFYGPMLWGYRLYDGAEDKAAVTEAVDRALERFYPLGNTKI